MSQPPGPQQQPYPPQQYPPQAQYAPAGPPPKKKSKAGKVIAIVGGVLLLLIIAAAVNGGGKSGTTASTPTVEQPAAQPPAVQQPAAPAKRVVVYEVTGTGTANNITYSTDGMTSTEQLTNVQLPWSKTIELKSGEAIQVISLLAQNGGSGEINVKATVDGKVVKEGKGSGPYAIANISENIGTLFK